MAKLRRYAREVPKGTSSPEELATDGPVDWLGEFGREHGVNLSTRPAYEPAEGWHEGEAEALTWQDELLAEYTRGDPARARARGRHLGASAPMLPKGFRADLVRPNPEGFEADKVPKNDAEYRQLLHRVFDPHKRELARQMMKVPVFQGAYDIWDHEGDAAKTHVMWELFDRINALMGPIYQFRPAAMGYMPNLRGAMGMYVEEKRQVMLGASLLRMPVQETFATIIHEQIHKLQYEMMWRLDHPGVKALTLDERYLVYYWIRCELNGRRERAYHDLYVNGKVALYRALPIEYHAFDTEESIIPLLNRAYERRRR